MKVDNYLQPKVCICKEWVFFCGIYFETSNSSYALCKESKTSKL